MRPLPTSKLDPRIKMVWRLNDALWITIAALCVVLPLWLISLDADEPLLFTAAVVAAAIAVALYVLCLVVLPPIRYQRWRYQLTEDYLEIALGIVWRKRFIIPFIRVQNTDTRQGPIMRVFGLSSVTVATAAGNHEIPGLDVEQAEQVRDRAAELARLAREDV
ncbi:PH domain-containing protein [Parvibacter caecicola]|uniref:PH domain-containing protein n=1 Tax=Parvibacter caecicola TaxID=747645 RepID=UPI0027317CDD|nr:PH domain-containing protein [Parvibacter caecicola]